jgi:iron complex outermembrane recepter protein
MLTHEVVRDAVGALINGDALAGVTLGANNPYNPFGQAVGVSFSFDNLLNQNRASGDFARPLVGIRGDVSSDWHYEVTAYASRDRYTLVSPTANASAVQGALDSSSPALALNPFTVQAPNGALLQSLLNSPTDQFFENRLIGSQALLRGDVVQLPAGTLKAVVGAEYNEENLQEPPLIPNLHRNTYAAFSELRIPVVGGSGQAPDDERLAVTAAGRYDHSSDFGGKGTWQSALQWRPVRELLFRGGYSVSYEAPLLQQLAGGQQFSFIGSVGVVDPFRGGQPVASSEVSFASNPNLKPQTGNARDLGMVFAGQNGVSASLTWYDLEISNYIFAPPFQTLIDYSNLFPGAVVRSPPTPQDIQQGYLGQIVALNDSYYNFGRLHVSGVDLGLRYVRDTAIGQFTPSVAIANVYRWDSAITPGAPLVSYLSRATLFGPGFSPRWKGTAAIAWRRKRLSLSVDGRYVSRYKDYQDVVPNSNELGDFWIFDLNARYDIGNASGYGMYVAAGAINLFARTPQGSYIDIPWDQAEMDIRGRTLYLQVGVKWQ